MQKIKITILLMFVVLNCYSQDFSPVGAKWHFPIHYWGPSIGVFSIESMSDTIIANKNCKRLYRDGYTFDGGIGDIFLYQNQDTVYKYSEQNDKFEQIIVFNLEVGDTFLIEQSEFLLGDTMHCIIDSISYFNYTTTDSLKVQHVTWIATDSIDGNEHTYSMKTKLIEKIGFEIGILPRTVFSIADGARDGPIRCYEDINVDLIMFDDVDCLFTPTIELEKSYNIKLYPNPITEKLQIRVQEYQINKIRIFDLAGRLKLNLNDPGFSIDLSYLDSGMYFVEINIDNNAIYKRIIKH